MLEGVLRRVRTWREAEIKLRKGVWEQKVLEEAVVPRGGGVGGRRKRKRGVSVEEDKDEEEEEEDVSELAVVGKRGRREPSQVKSETAGESTEQVGEDTGVKKKGGRRKKLTAFGEDIPKVGLMNREFKIPAEWVPEDKRV